MPGGACGGTKATLHIGSSMGGERCFAPCVQGAYARKRPVLPLFFLASTCVCVVEECVCGKSGTFNVGKLVRGGKQRLTAAERSKLRVDFLDSSGVGGVFGGIWWWRECFPGFFGRRKQWYRSPGVRSRGWRDGFWNLCELKGTVHTQFGASLWPVDGGPSCVSRIHVVHGRVLSKQHRSGTKQKIITWRFRLTQELASRRSGGLTNSTERCVTSQRVVDLSPVDPCRSLPGVHQVRCLRGLHEVHVNCSRGFSLRDCYC